MCLMNISRAQICEIVVNNNNILKLVALVFVEVVSELNVQSHIHHMSSQLSKPLFILCVEFKSHLHGNDS